MFKTWGIDKTAPDDLRARFPNPENPLRNLRKFIGRGVATLGVFVGVFVALASPGMGVSCFSFFPPWPTSRALARERRREQVPPTRIRGLFQAYAMRKV